VALYRAGNCVEAVQTLHKSAALQGGGNAYEFLFQAMAHWQLGDRRAAQEWYTKAMVWMYGHGPHYHELLRFQAEAAELLGRIAPPPRPVVR
jgi:hypothetical protein